MFASVQIACLTKRHSAHWTTNQSNINDDCWRENGYDCMRGDDQPSISAEGKDEMHVRHQGTSYSHFPWNYWLPWYYWDHTSLLLNTHSVHRADESFPVSQRCYNLYCVTRRLSTQQTDRQCHYDLTALTLFTEVHHVPNSYNVLFNISPSPYLLFLFAYRLIIVGCFEWFSDFSEYHIFILFQVLQRWKLQQMRCHSLS